MDMNLHEVGRWDLAICHPPCTDLAVSGARWFPNKWADYRQQKAVAFFMQMFMANADRIAVENPVCIMASVYRKPDQIIQPYQFGHRARKATCLWLTNLPKLVPTNIVNPGEFLAGGYSVGAHADGRDENGKWLRRNDPKLAKLRSKTFQGIADAMAEQWGSLEVQE